MNYKSFVKRLKDREIHENDIALIVNTVYRNESKTDLENSLTIELTPKQLEEIYTFKKNKDKDGLSEYLKKNKVNKENRDLIENHTITRDKKILIIHDDNTIGPTDLVYLILGLIRENPKNLVSWFKSGNYYFDKEEFLRNGPWNTRGIEAKNKQIASLRPIDSQVKGPEPCTNPRCRSEYTYISQKQTRAGDEMLTTKIICQVCSNSFTPSR